MEIDNFKVQIDGAILDDKFISSIKKQLSDINGLSIKIDSVDISGIEKSIQSAISADKLEKSFSDSFSSAFSNFSQSLDVIDTIMNLDCQKVHKNCPDFYNWSNIDEELIKWFTVQVYVFGSSKINQRGVIAGI